MPRGCQRAAGPRARAIRSCYWTVELTYQMAIAPWLVVQPDAQFFLDPAFSRRDAYAFGLQTVVIF